MGPFLFLIFIVVPLTEILLFIEVGGFIGGFATVAVVILTAGIGAQMLRRQGLAVMRRAQDSLAQGRMPVADVLDGACLLVAGALLLTPGFLTDSLGIMLFIPPVRRWLAKAVLLRFGIHGLAGRAARPHNGQRHDPPPGSTVIEGEYREIPDHPPDDPTDHRAGDSTRDATRSGGDQKNR
ncbi:MAG: FxsA family protein [Sphingomonadales bacterium]